MRRHLIDPLGHAGIGVARKDGHRPFIVTWPLTRIPGRGIARTIIDEVQLRIQRAPPPSAAPPVLPLFALPGFEARVLADRLAALGVFWGPPQNMAARPSRMSPPYRPAALQVIGG